MPIRITATVDPSRSHVEARTEHDRLIVLGTEPPENGDPAPGPKEALLAALAGCTAMDVASILRKKRQSVEAYEISASGDSADEHPKRFIAVTVEHRVRGDVTSEALRRSIELSATRYCPINATLSASCVVEHRYRLTTSGGEVHSALVAVTGPEGSRVL